MTNPSGADLGMALFGRSLPTGDPLAGEAIPSCCAVRVDAGLQVTEQGIEATRSPCDGGDELFHGAGEDRLHRRVYVYRAGHHHFRCSCGFVSGGFVSEARARDAACDVEQALLASGVRLRALHLGETQLDGATAAAGR